LQWIVVKSTGQPTKLDLLDDHAWWRSGKGANTGTLLGLKAGNLHFEGLDIAVPLIELAAELIEEGFLGAQIGFDEIAVAPAAVQEGKKHN
jgi:hypothetical protein